MPPSRDDPAGTALELARGRYLRGECDADEFEQLAGWALAGDWDSFAGVMRWRPLPRPSPDVMRVVRE